MDTTGRRPLTFASLNEVMPDVDRLLSGGYTALGKWSLGQICKHLSGAIVYSIEGFPERAPWLIRVTIGPLMVRSMFKTGSFREGIKVPERYIPTPGLDDRAEAEALRGAIRLFAQHTGPLAGHPIVNRMSREDWERFHSIHCSHHLSFLIPAPTAA
jgi:hypothetical protein